MKSIVADRLKLAREQKNLNQIDVYNITGINNKTLSGYENGVSSPDLKTLIRLADLYEVTADYLLGRVDKRSEAVMRVFCLDEKTGKTISLDGLDEEESSIVKNLIKFLMGKKQHKTTEK